MTVNLVVNGDGAVEGIGEHGHEFLNAGKPFAV